MIAVDARFNNEEANPMNQYGRRNNDYQNALNKNISDELIMSLCPE
jgi:hypothetical protein